MANLAVGNAASNTISNVPSLPLVTITDNSDNKLIANDNLSKSEKNPSLSLSSSSPGLLTPLNEYRLHASISSSGNIKQASRQFSILHTGRGLLGTDSLTYLKFHRLRRIAYLCCILSFIFDIILGVTAFVNCIRSKSFVGFSYSVDTLMDSLCIAFVSWHLSATSLNDMHRRDRLACCVIGALFIGSFLAIESRAIQNMILAQNVRPDVIVFIYSTTHIIVFTVLSIIKIIISKQIKSSALMADALNSIIGIIMVFPLLLWDRVTFLNKFAHLDDLVQVLMALFLFITGWKLILDSITQMNSEYSRCLREEKLRRMLRENDDDYETDFEILNMNQPNSIAPMSQHRFSIISTNIKK
ncbi:unnamed protein product [Didymodactylos carnosus]|uniref:Transmembrane protein 163 n=1 Tax=Didymodactylos carnosus TaxID=1234261 RepID=A0A813S7L5_9BILA|nr:unnamed protein product [Didymodactylos carnosus]CAF3575447.1 unnamed protein product [Didymodactylos carnosus]